MSLLKNKKILFVFGTRPEAIKMAPVIKVMIEQGLHVSVGLTAQHRQMLDQVITFFEIPVHYDLNIMQEGQTLNQLSGRLFHEIDSMLIDAQPNLVMVHGDTTTSWIAAMCAFHRGIEVAHVEAGLRTYNKHSPFPEEINRQLITKIADIHFAPTSNAAEQLRNEQILPSNILVTGNTVIDALHLGVKKIEEGFESTDLTSVKKLIQPSNRMILVTGHRRENFGDGFEQLCKAIATIATSLSDVDFIYPVHLNPQVQEPVNRILGDFKNVHLIAPVDYPAFIYLMQKSYFILTDSGGVQEEGPALGKPILVMRNTTERPEAVNAGTVILTGTDTLKIVEQCKSLLNDNKQYQRMSTAINPYGDGKAAGRICEFIIHHFKHTKSI